MCDDTLIDVTAGSIKLAISFTSYQQQSKTTRYTTHRFKEEKQAIYTIMVHQEKFGMPTDMMKDNVLNGDSQLDNNILFLV